MGHTPPSSSSLVQRPVRPVTEFWTKGDVPCNRCGVVNARTKMLCAICKRWWHPACENKQMTYDDLSSGKWTCKGCQNKNKAVPPPEQVINLDETSRSEIIAPPKKPAIPEVSKWSSKCQPCSECLIHDAKLKVVCPLCSNWYHENCGGAPTQIEAASVGFNGCQSCINMELFTDSHLDGAKSDKNKTDFNDFTGMDQLTERFTKGSLKDSTRTYKEKLSKTSQRSKISTASQARQIELMEKELDYGT